MGIFCVKSEEMIIFQYTNAPFESSLENKWNHDISKSTINLVFDAMWKLLSLNYSAKLVHFQKDASSNRELELQNARPKVIL